LEFSKDNSSQLLGVTTDGLAKTFLLKGKILTAKEAKSPYYNSKNQAEPPMQLLPYYDLNY